MNTKRILIGLPIFVSLLLLQSAFWVPSQKRQAVMAPSRLSQYISGNIGDAAILNPILNADSASSEICDKVFDSLLDYDENLNFRPRLATSWRIFEEAYLWVNPNGVFPDGTKISATELQRRILNAKNTAPSNSLLGKIEKIKILPPSTETRPLPLEIQEENLTEVKIRFPKRLQITLSKVEQDLFKELEKKVLGQSYLRTISTLGGIHGIPKEKVKTLAPYVVSAAEHNPVIIFNLRKGVRYQDGKPFSAKDVKFTYEALMNGKNLSPRRSDYEPVKSVEILNPHKIKVTYKRLYSPAIGTWAIGLLPKHLLDEKALAKEAKEKQKDPQAFTMRQSGFNRHPIGTGAFRFLEWKNDQYIKLIRNEDYWEGPPNYKEYLYRVIPEAISREMEFYAGAIDGYGPAPYQVERFKKAPQYQNFSGLSYGYDYIGYNMRRKLFQDPRVRKALGMAIDVNTMIRYIKYNHAEKITGPFVKQTPYYNHEIAPLPYDPEGAQKLLEEAGWVKDSKGKLVHKTSGEPFRFTLITNNGNDIRRDIMIIAQQAWAKLGIEISIQLVEWAVFIKKHVDLGNFDALVLGWSMGIEPDLYQIWHSSQTNPQQLNFVGYKNPKADDLIIRIRQEYDRNKLIQYCHQLHQIIYDDQPYTFLTVSRWTALLDKRIVRKIKTPAGEVYKKITPTKTGNYSFYFNQWVKLKNPKILNELAP